jgi:hypothetical protein
VQAIHAPEVSSDDECIEVVTDGEVELTGLKERNLEMPGVRALYKVLLEETCPEVLAAKNKTALSKPNERT